MAKLADAGYIVAIANAQDLSGQTWTVRADSAYDALVELAQQLGFDLADE